MKGKQPEVAEKVTLAESAGYKWKVLRNNVRQGNRL